jgi:predicted  nucleic acid-binding Zn-ribbon protein
MKQIVLGLIFIFFSLQIFAQSAQRLEDLFIWKVSDELKLSAVEEEEFASQLRALNTKRKKLNDEIENLLKEMGELSLAQKESELPKKLRDYERKIKQYSDTQVEEIKQVEKVLGVRRAAVYFSLKNDLVFKIRQSLSPQPRSISAPKLAPPKVVID